MTKEETKEQWNGPKSMSQQLYDFADAYFWATGKDRTFKWAAVKAGAKVTSAHALGHKWSKFSIVQEYWKSLEETYTGIRKNMNMQSLMRLEDLANRLHSGEEVQNVGAIKEIESLIIDNTNRMFEDATIDAVVSGEIKDESTRNTMLDIMLSVQALVGKDDSPLERGNEDVEDEE